MCQHIGYKEESVQKSNSVSDADATTWTIENATEAFEGVRQREVNRSHPVAREAEGADGKTAPV